MHSYTTKQKLAINTMLLIICSTLSLTACTNKEKTEVNSGFSSNQSTTKTQIPEKSTEEKTWQNILPGETAYGLTFSQEEKLFNGDNLLLEEIVVSYGEDGSKTYAKKLKVSPASPSSKFNVFKGCESTDETGLCWVAYLVNKEQGTVEEIVVGKYGGIDWIKWSEESNYAVMAQSQEGVFWFYVIDLVTGESQSFEEINNQLDLDSFQWLDATTFQVEFKDSDGTFTGDIKLLQEVN